MTDTAVQFHGLGYAYHMGHWVFQNYTAEVKRGTIFALLGPNGSGKTTLLKLILRAMEPTNGSVAVNGQVAFVPQLFQVSFDYSVLDMVLMGRARQVGMFSQPSAKDESAALASLERFGVRDLAGRPFHELSGGQRQLVIFARAVVSEADILILDEPTSALDLKNQGMILDWIARLSHEDGLTVVMTTHHPHHAMAVADQALLMLEQTEYACGAVSDVLTEENLRSLYGVDLRRISFESGGRAVETFVPIFPRYTRTDKQSQK